MAFELSGRIHDDPPPAVHELNTAALPPFLLAHGPVLSEYEAGHSRWTRCPIEVPRSSSVPLSRRNSIGLAASAIACASNAGSSRVWQLIERKLSSIKGASLEHEVVSAIAIMSTMRARCGKSINRLHFFCGLNTRISVAAPPESRRQRGGSGRQPAPALTCRGCGTRKASKYTRRALPRRNGRRVASRRPRAGGRCGPAGLGAAVAHYLYLRPIRWRRRDGNAARPDNCNRE